MNNKKTAEAITVSEIYDEWSYFLSKINFKDSFLDGRSIQFMNNFKMLLEKLEIQTNDEED